MIRVRWINSDPAHETSWRRCGIDAVEGHVSRRCVVGVRRDEHATAPEPGPKRDVVARSALRSDYVAARTRVLVSPEGRAAQVLSDRDPVAAGRGEGAEELVTIRFQEGLAAVVVLRPPNVLESRERRPVDRRVVDNRDVERATFASCGPRGEECVGDPIPTHLLGAVKVHVDLRIEVGVETLVRVEHADARLATVAENADKPAAGALACESLGAVVLRPAHDVVE